MSDWIKQNWIALLAILISLVNVVGLEIWERRFRSELARSRDEFRIKMESILNAESMRALPSNDVVVGADATADPTGSPVRFWY